MVREQDARIERRAEIEGKKKRGKKRLKKPHRGTGNQADRWTGKER